MKGLGLQASLVCRTCQQIRLPPYPPSSEFSAFSFPLPLLSSLPPSSFQGMDEYIFQDLNHFLLSHWNCGPHGILQPETEDPAHPNNDQMHSCLAERLSFGCHLSHWSCTEVAGFSYLRINNLTCESYRERYKWSGNSHRWVGLDLEASCPFLQVLLLEVFPANLPLRAFYVSG